MRITVAQLMRAMPSAGLQRADAFVAPLNAAVERWGIDTAPRAAAFLAQAAHESSHLRHLEESLNYSAAALCSQWPRHFTPEIAARCARDPVATANQAYADRMGNGDAASGDGWRYHGRGIFQLTGRANYRECSIAVAGDADTLLINPELVATPEYACESAAWFWASHRLNELADAGDFEGITRRINGGLIGFKERCELHDLAIAALS